MAKHNRQASDKVARNAAYADLYPRRGRGTRKKARAERVAGRERDWCVAQGLDPTPPKPPVSKGRRRRPT